MISENLEKKENNELIKILTFKEVVELLRISESELRKLISLNQIVCFEIGENDSKRKLKMFRYSDVLDYIEKHIIRS